MAQSAGQVIDRLGKDGLARVLDDLMDKPRLDRLATACDLKYPGVRIRSVKRDRLLVDLVARAETDEATREAIHRALEKETRAERRRWNSLSAEEKARRLSTEEFLRTRGNLGRHLWLLASTDDGGEESFGNLARQHLQSMIHNGQSTAEEPSASRAELRLKRRVADFEKKVLHAESQLARSRENERRLKKDLIERKGELAESRMLSERTRRELDDTRQTLDRVRASKPEGVEPALALDPLERAIKRLSSGQKTMTRALEKLNFAADKRPAIASTEISGLRQGVDSLQKESSALRREQQRGIEELTKRIEELAAAKPRPAPPKERKPRIREADKRVGVFIDVQNMYYGARKLKGKLDFDALMESAVTQRRLIQSTAYVVESKEIDQSGFIARLQQKAIEVRRKTLRVRADGSMKGDWDMELALDILDAAANLDVVVLVSGDGDFTSLVKRVKRIGPRVEVIAFPRTTAKSLVEAADRYQALDRKFMIYQRETRNVEDNARQARKTKPDD